MKENSRAMRRRLCLALVFLVPQSLGLADCWAADGALPPVTWKYKYVLPEDQVVQHDVNIRNVAAKSNASVTYAYATQNRGDKSAVQVVVDGRSTVTDLKNIILGSNVGIKNLVDQPIKLSIKGYAAKQSAISLVLDSNMTTGHQWRLDPSSVGAVAGEVAGLYEHTSSLLGGAGRQTFILNPLADGNLTILLNYARQWEPTAEEPGTLDIQADGPLPEAIDLSTPPQLGTASSLLDQATQLPPTQFAVSSTPLLGLPTSYDLRTSGGLTAVKDQGQCGSCWAFATVGVLEGLIKRNTGTTVDLSEQFLVSCNKSSWSCNGGGWAHDYHKTTLGSQQSVAGAVLEADKPYSASNGTCTPIPNHPYALASWAYVGAYNSVPSTTAIKNAIYTYGPVSAAICAGSAFGRYSSGVFSTNEASTCSPGSTNHAIVLVGWNDSTQTWLLRNSWGTGWGESGYMRIAYGTSNVGYAANYANYSNSCAYGISPTTATAAAPGGTASIAVTTQSACSWTASSNVSWISLTSGGSGSGSGTVAYSVAPNTGSARTGTITAAGQSLTVTQAGAASCTYTVSPTSIAPGAAGLTGNITVTTQSGCAWSASNPLGWVSIVSGSSGTGSGTVIYSVSANTGSARSGTLTIAGKTVSIAQQAPVSCTYALNSVSNSFNSGGGSNTVSVITQSSCAWSAASNSSWLSVNAGTSGSGSGTVGYSASANTSTSSRGGSLTIAGQTFAVSQLGGSQGGDGQLNNGVALVGQTLTASLSQDSWKYYSLSIPSGAANLIIDMYGLTGDLDLFGSQGAKPSFSAFDCGSYQSALSKEQCVITAPTAGTWWVGVNNYDVGNLTYTLKASWGAADNPLQNGVAASGGVASSPTMTWKYFYIDVPAGATNLAADLYNLTGDADIYLKYGSKPDIYSVDDCDSVNYGTTPENCTITYPTAGRWWIAVVNYDPSVSYLIRAATSGPPSCTLTASPASVVAGAATTLVASCNQAATSYVWTGGNCAGSTASTCTVAPSATTTYTVAGINGAGQGDAASAKVMIIGSSAAQYATTVQQLYLAYFGRAADPGGLANFEAALLAAGAPISIQDLVEVYATNSTIRALIDSFGTSAESGRLYTGDATAFITGVFNNIVRRPPAGTFWIDALNSGSLTRGLAALSIMAGALANTTAQGLIDAATVTNKVIVASNFTNSLTATAQTRAYSGQNAAASVRAMLSAVSSTTNISAFQSTIDTTISYLVAVSP